MLCCSKWTPRPAMRAPSSGSCGMGIRLRTPIVVPRRKGRRSDVVTRGEYVRALGPSGDARSAGRPGALLRAARQVSLLLVHALALDEPGLAVLDEREPYRRARRSCQ